MIFFDGKSHILKKVIEKFSDGFKLFYEDLYKSSNAFNKVHNNVMQKDMFYLFVLLINI